MKTIVSICILSFIMLSGIVGCVTIKHDDFVYRRWWGKQSIDGLTILKHPNGIMQISLDKQKSDSGNLDKFLSNAAKLGVEATKLITAGSIGGAVVK